MSEDVLLKESVKPSARVITADAQRKLDGMVGVLIVRMADPTHGWVREQLLEVGGVGPRSFLALVETMRVSVANVAEAWPASVTYARFATYHSIPLLDGVGAWAVVQSQWGYRMDTSVEIGRFADRGVAIACAQQFLLEAWERPSVSSITIVHPRGNAAQYRPRR